MKLNKFIFQRFCDFAEPFIIYIQPSYNTALVFIHIVLGTNWPYKNQSVLKVPVGMIDG